MYVLSRSLYVSPLHMLLLLFCWVTGHVYQSIPNLSKRGSMCSAFLQVTLTWSMWSYTPPNSLPPSWPYRWMHTEVASECCRAQRRCCIHELRMHSRESCRTPVVQYHNIRVTLFVVKACINSGNTSIVWLYFPNETYRPTQYIV